MNKIILFSCVFTILFYETFGDVAISPANPKYPGKCFSPSTGLMKPNEEKYLKDCVKARCSINGEIYFESCRVGVDVMGCELEQDLSKKFPDCCPHQICPQNYSVMQ